MELHSFYQLRTVACCFQATTCSGLPPMSARARLPCLRSPSAAAATSASSAPQPAASTATTCSRACTAAATRGEPAAPVDYGLLPGPSWGKCNNSCIIPSMRALLCCHDRGDGEQASTSGRPAHDGAVSGISSDACNRLVVTAGADGALRVRESRFATTFRVVPYHDALGHNAAQQQCCLAVRRTRSAFETCKS